MSNPRRITLVGATGLIGRAIMRASVGREDIRLTAVSRREVPLPKGARMEMVIADPANWPEVIAETKPDVLISALGTTWKKAGKDEDTFRAVDLDLVVASAKAARKAGAQQMILVSSGMANAASKNFYLSVKGQAEAGVTLLKFDRTDILHPGLLVGKRINDPRFAETAGIILSPVMNVFLHGRARKMRSIRDDVVARGALSLALAKQKGRFVHDNDAIVRASRQLST